MTRVIHIDELSHPSDESTLFACQYLSLILLVTMLHPYIHNKDTHYSLSKHPLFTIHIAIFKLSHQLSSQNKEVFVVLDLMPLLGKEALQSLLHKRLPFAEGKPLLLVHDLEPASSSYEWHEVRKRLAKDHTVYTSDSVIVATGGLSYPTTGSTGDGYRFATETGHKVTECIPSLVPLTTREDYIPLMKGLSLRNVELTIKRGKKTVYQDFGEMMFTHFGITGPLVLSASAKIGKFLQKGEELNAFLDLKPALSHEQLDDRILREFSAAQNKQFKNVIGVLFPSSLTPVIIGIGPISGDKIIHDISRESRLAFGSLVKAFPFTITGLGGFSEAVITRGGVSVKDIQPGSMESKLIKNLYFIGEVLDLDAVTGGYNLQIAWSTAYLAATDVCRNKEEDI